MYTLDSVWPQPPAGHAYVEQRLTGGDYLSTGYYPDEIARQRGKGRSVENCVAVTSLLLDCDLVGWLMSMRRVMRSKEYDRVVPYTNSVPSGLQIG